MLYQPLAAGRVLTPMPLELIIILTVFSATCYCQCNKVLYSYVLFYLFVVWIKVYLMFRMVIVNKLHCKVQSTLDIAISTITWCP